MKIILYKIKDNEKMLIRDRIKNKKVKYLVHLK